MDILFITVPKLIVRSPLLGPATLSAICEKNGFSTAIMDINIELWHLLKDKHMEHIWGEDDPTFMSQVKFNQLVDEYIEGDIVNSWLDTIERYSPVYIGISVLHQRNEHATRYLINKIIGHKNLCHCKIILGAPHASVIGPNLLVDNMITAYVSGDGEEAIINILNGDYNQPGINGNDPVQLKELSQYPYPNYKNLDLAKYVKSNYGVVCEESLPTETLFINSSRGCIKRCNFCDVASRWPDFVSKSGEQVVNEMEYLITRYPQINKFSFTNSLLNGDVPALYKLCTILNERKLPLTFYGQWITRPRKVLPPEYYDLFKSAGLTHLIIGIESGSQKINNDMKKGVCIDDIYYTFEQLTRVGISSTPLFSIGYPSERYENIKETITLIKNMVPYKTSISSMALGPTCMVTNGTPLHRDIEKHNIRFSSNSGWSWFNENSDFKTRIEWWFEVFDVVVKSGFRVDHRSTTWLNNEYDTIAKGQYTPAQIANISREKWQ